MNNKMIITTPVRDLPNLTRILRASTVLLLLAGMARGQEPPAAESAADLAKKLSNPIAALVSVPFQFNWEQGVGPNDGTRFILNVQPVMPFALTKDVNLIARVIVPLVSQPVLVAGGAPTFGVSDVLTSFFISPSKASKVIWGAGPVVNFPSTSEPPGRPRPTSGPCR
jgi:hypothetical protein